MNTQHNRYRIAFSATSEQDLWALADAFRGNIEHGAHQEGSDDFLVAVVLGWHMRNLASGFPYFGKSIAWEFGLRQSIASSPHHDTEAAARRLAARGTPSTPGNVLTIDGIDNKTYRRIETRIHALTAMIKKLEEISRNHSNEELEHLLTRYSDQAIIDLSVWTILSSEFSPDAQMEPFPNEYKDEILARGQARAEYEAGTLNEVDVVDDTLPALSPRDRRAFLIKRRIHPGSQFWTDARIRAALEMGL